MLCFLNTYFLLERQSLSLRHKHKPSKSPKFSLRLPHEQQGAKHTNYHLLPPKIYHWQEERLGSKPALQYGMRVSHAVCLNRMCLYLQHRDRACLAQRPEWLDLTGLQARAQHSEYPCPRSRVAQWREDRMWLESGGLLTICENLSLFHNFPEFSDESSHSEMKTLIRPRVMWGLNITCLAQSRHSINDKDILFWERSLLGSVRPFVDL